MRFASILAVDLTLAILLLASVSFLTYIPPAKVTSQTRDLAAKRKVDDLGIAISISPGHVGQNTFTLQLTSNGQPVRSVQEALLRFTPSQANIPPSDLELIAQGDGTFSAKGANLSLPSNWQVQAIVRRENKFDAYANFNFRLNAAGAVEQDAAIPREAGGLVAVRWTLVWAIAVLSNWNTWGPPCDRHPACLAYDRGGNFLCDAARFHLAMNRQIQFLPTANRLQQARPFIRCIACPVMGKRAKEMAHSG